MTLIKLKYLFLLPAHFSTRKPDQLPNSAQIDPHMNSVWIIIQRRSFSVSSGELESTLQYPSNEWHTLLSASLLPALPRFKCLSSFVLQPPLTPGLGRRGSCEKRLLTIVSRTSSRRLVRSLPRAALGGLSRADKERKKKKTKEAPRDLIKTHLPLCGLTATLFTLAQEGEKGGSEDGSGSLVDGDPGRRPAGFMGPQLRHVDSGTKSGISHWFVHAVAAENVPQDSKRMVMRLSCDIYRDEKGVKCCLNSHVLVSTCTTSVEARKVYFSSIEPV